MEGDRGCPRAPLPRAVNDVLGRGEEAMTEGRFTHLTTPVSVSTA